jgi:MtN3 and saliva related transmembrane protein
MSGIDTTEALGMAAAVFSTSSFLPQAIRLLVRKETAAVSLVTYIVFAIGVALWLAYGVALGRWSIILANAITLIFVGAIIAAKLRYG